MSEQNEKQAAVMSTPILKHFRFAESDPRLAELGGNFEGMAHWIAKALPPGPETTVALRKLLESRDAALRALP